jgi:5-methylcytosine-specific restriction endonuclease McrA
MTLVRCSRCKEEKQPSAYSPDRRRPSGLQCQCKACRVLASMEYDRSNASRVSKRRKEWRRANRTRLTAKRREWVRNNPKRWQATVRRHYDRHPEQLVANQRRRYARARGATEGDFTAQDWKRLLEVYGQTCAYCQSGQALHADHLMPLSRGGQHTLENIVPACRHCNSRKHAKTPLEWFLVRT